MSVSWELSIELFIEVAFLFIFFDDIFVGFLKVLGQNDVTILPHRLHASLETKIKVTQKLSILLKSNKIQTILNKHTKILKLYAKINHVVLVELEIKPPGRWN